MKRALAALTALPLALLAGACSPSKSEPPAAPLPTPPPLASAAASVAPPPAPPAGSLDSAESRKVAKTLRRVADLRGLTAKRAVPGIKLERAGLAARVKEKALREYPADALRREGLLLEQLGFAPPGFDYLAQMTTLLEAQLEGFYEPNDGSMYLAAEMSGKEAEAALAHELVHALQDQHYDLKPRSTYRPGKSDETLALACLAEGDATSLMMDYMLAGENKTALDLPEAMLRELMANGIDAQATRSVPHVLRTSLVAPYVEGLAFVDALRRDGGWPAVDRAWERAPASTEQVLHPEKWRANEAPLALPAPTGGALGADWKREDEDTLGELGFVLDFEEWMSPADARSAAAGWGGDRSSTWAKGDELAYAVHTRYDEATKGAKDALAKNGFAKVAAAWRAKLAKKAALDEAALVCVERADRGPLLVARKDRDLVLVVGPAARRGDAWTSTSTCATAKRWATEILGAR